MASDTRLDAQYNLRAAFPDFPKHVEDWQRRSETSCRQLNWTLAIPYGSHPSMKLDVCRPEQPAGPIHVFFHGGYWMAMGREFFKFIADPLIAIGVTVVIPSYPLAPAATMAEIAAAATAAMLWIRLHATELGADPQRISVSGHSAGGHLAALMSAKDWRNHSPDHRENLVSTGICISGIYDLEPIRSTYLNDTLKLREEDVTAYSPLRLEMSPTAPPLLLIVGSKETEEFHGQQWSYARRCLARRRSMSALTVADRDHFEVVSDVFSIGTPAFAMLSHAIFRNRTV
jgi:arylformamidase